MATNIPPHNLTEVIDACLALLANPKPRVDELIEHRSGARFPDARESSTALEGVREGYRTGRGRVVMRARTHIEDSDKGSRQAIIVDELPYQVNKANLLISASASSCARRSSKASPICATSRDKSGMRVVIELKRGEVPEIVLNNLYKLTQLQDSFGMNMVALVDGQPRLLNLKQFLEYFLQHRREVVVRRTRLRAAQGARARARAGRPRGRALQRRRDHRADQGGADAAGSEGGADGAGSGARRWSRRCCSAPPPTPRGPEGLPPEFGWHAQAKPPGYRLSDAQAQAILELRLQRLTGLEQDKIIGEYKGGDGRRSSTCSTSSRSRRA